MTNTKYLNRSQLVKFFGINDNAMGKFLRNGHPSPVKGKGYDLAESAAWFAGRPSRGKAKDKALAYLAELNPAKSDPPTAPAKPKRPGKKGIEAGVLRLRIAEEALHRTWSVMFEGGATGTATAFRDWQAALDLLSKAEHAMLKFKKDMGELTDTAKFKKWMKERIAAAKSILLDLPSRVAPQCEGMAWHQIQKLLDAEVRRALQKLAERN
jgi:phage terminase Nu1 subunit (DNA packaging protein)